MEFLKGFVIFKKNKLVFIVLLFLLLNIPFAMYFLTSKRFSVLGWFNQGWLYRREIVLSENGSNIDVLIPIDTANLILQGKMRSDCGDIRFVDSDDTTALQYWIEDGCNTTSTQIWIRVPSSTSGKKIYMYYGNNGATSTQMNWGGNVYMYSDTVCPEGWTRASEMDNRFLYGSNTFGQTGGSETHTHGNASCISTSISSAPVTATSGHTIHTFKNSGTFVVSQQITAEVLIVAGGGGGGANHGGGGGAGGLIATTHTFAPGSYTVTVGEGGAGGTGSSAGGNGGNSSIGSLVATGGGGGGGFNGYYWTSAGNGGSGGGASRRQYNPGRGIAGQGHDGASSNYDESIHAGGGGGAGSAGFRGTSAHGGNGGNGYASSISGSLRYYAGGGGGGSGNNNGLGGGYGHSGGGRGNYFNTPGANAVPNTGSGGGGGGSSWDVFINSGGKGGSGIVIVKYSGNRVTNGGIVSPSIVETSSTNHTHSMSVGTNGASNIPTYKNVVVCKKNSFSIPAGMISQFVNTPMNGWSLFNGFDGYFLKPSTSYGGTGGSNTHTHTLIPMNTSTPNSGGSIWGTQYFTAEGGSVSVSGSDKIHTFTSSGNFRALGNGFADVLVVAGGGGGGNTGSGGGGGGFVSDINFPVNAGDYPVVVGLGGSGGKAPGAPGTQGGSSTFSSISAIGGGGGVTHGSSGHNGGSGGGAGLKTTSPDATGGTGVAGQGNAGGPGRVHAEWKGSNAGGGGAGSIGGSSVIDWSQGGTGGHGFPSSISGTERYYAGGGFGGEVKQGGESTGGVSGGGTTVQNGPGGNGVANTGGGGGGGSYDENASTHDERYKNGGDGGSGIVIIRYPLLPSVNVSSQNHMHSTSASMIDSASNIPPYRKMIFGKSNTNVHVRSNDLIITSAIPPLGYNRFPAMDSLFVLGASAYGETGGSATHQHNISIQTGMSSASVAILGGTGLNFIGANHTHSCSTVSTTASNISPYYSVIYAQRKTSMSVTVGSETTQNNKPDTPTSLQTNSQTNPQNITNLLPTFSAIFSDPDNTEKSSHYQIQLNTTLDFTGTVLWDTGKTAFTELVNNGERTPQIQYSGSPLSFGTRYYWRIKLWDNNPTLQGESPWSQTAEFTTIGIPSTPTPLEPTATSTTSILWNFTYTTGIPSGVKILDEDDNLVKTCLGENITYCEETELSENTQYKRKIVAFNSIGDSSPSSLVSRYTLISVPSINLISKTVNSIQISTSTLLPNSQIYFDCIEDNECDNGLNIWNTTTEATSSSLNYNTKYSYQAKARNGDNIETAYSSPLSVYTLSPVPTVESLDITKDTITLKQTLTNNLTEGLSGMLFEVENNYNNFEGIDIWLKTPALVKPLHSSTTYKFRAKSRNYDAIESGFSAYTQITTLPNTPEIVGSNVEKTATSISFDITKESLGPHSLQSYSVYEEITGKYLNMGTLVLQDTQTWSEYLNGVSTPKITINSLSPSTEYRFSVISRNFFGVASSNTIPFTTFTKISTPTNFTAINVKHNEVTYSVDSTNTTPVETYKIFDENNEIKLICTKAQMLASECKEICLAENTQYKRKIQAFNSNTESDITNLHIFKTIYEYPKITEIRSSGSNHIQLTLVGDIGESVQIYEANEGKYYDLATQTLSSTPTSFSLINNIVVKELSPNHKYSFKTKGILGVWSPISEVYTLANTPTILKIDEINSSSIRIYLGNSENPSDTEFAIREENLNKYIDFSNGNLVNEPVYGKYLDFGGTNGIILKNLLTGRQYAFSAVGRNNSKNLTSWSQAKYIGLKGILLNVSNDISVNLLNTPNISPVTRENGQYGKHMLRVMSQNYILGDVPILFSQDRDWKNAIFVNSPNEKKAVIKLSTHEGLDGRFTMYVPTNNTDSFLICPYATNLSEISTDCKGVIKYTGQFPQEKEVEGYGVAVSKAILGGVEYWVADGLSGTGGMGYTEEKEKPKPSTKETIKTVEITERQEEHIQGNFVENFFTTISNLDEKTKQGIMTSTAVTTTAVSSFFIFTNISQIFYSLTHILNVLLALFGLKKKQRPYGYVYDSRTKEPVNMAIVRIFNNQGKLVTTSVTDSKGRFTGSIKEGIYTLTVSKHGYIFPSSIITEIIDPPTYNIYQNSFKVGQKQEIEIAVPIDSIENRTKSKIFRKVIVSKILLWLSILLLICGILFSTYMCVTYPTFINYFISSLYLIPLSTMLFVITKDEIKYGTVTDSQGMKVAGVSILLKEMDFGRIVQRRVTNERGEYRFILDKGTYQLIVGDKGKSNIFTIKEDNSIIAKDINIQ